MVSSRQLIKDADPGDGLRAFIETDPEKAFSVVVRMVCQGEVREDLGMAIMFECREPEDLKVAIGEALRVKLVADALCRFINTGGAAEGLETFVARVSETFRLDSISLPNHKLMDTGLNTEGEFEHYFFNEESESEGILWVEDRFMEVVDVRGVKEAAGEFENPGLAPKTHEV